MLCWLIQFINTLEACTLLSSRGCWFMITKLCEPLHTPFSSPIWGTGATPQSRSSISLKAFICQMPFQWKAFLPFWKATYSASCATSLGLCPSLTRSTIHVSASTPASELKVAFETSELYRSPPNCHRRDSHCRTPVNGKGETQLPWMPADLSSPSADSYSSLVWGGLLGSKPASSMSALL